MLPQTTAERRILPLHSRGWFLRRVARSAGLSTGILCVVLAAGALGYHDFEHLQWIDATLNAAMLLGGEGPLYGPVTAPGKIFATIYALFSGVVFVGVAGVLIAPLAHRFLHRFHLEIADDDAAG